MWNLVADNDLIVIAVAGGVVTGRWPSRRMDDPYHEYYARKTAHYVVVAITPLRTKLMEIG